MNFKKILLTSKRKGTDLLVESLTLRYNPMGNSPKWNQHTSILSASAKNYILQIPDIQPCKQVGLKLEKIVVAKSRQLFYKSISFNLNFFDPICF